MKPNPFLTTLFLVVLALSGGPCALTASAADQRKVPDVSRCPFFTDEKGSGAIQFVLGLTATMQLTELQKKRICAACEICSKEGASPARSRSTAGSAVAARKREKASVTKTPPITRLPEVVVPVLTSEQAGFLRKINAAYAAAVDEISAEYKRKLSKDRRFREAGSDPLVMHRWEEERKQALEKRLRDRLDGILTANQKKAMAVAAEEERRQLHDHRH